MSSSQLFLSYYFTTRILVLKFVNKGVFFEEIQDSHFSRNRDILVLTSLNLEKNGLILMSSVLQWKRVIIWTEKSVFYCKKGGSFWTKKSVFYHDKGVGLSWKVSVLLHKRGSFSNWRTRMGTTFSSEWGSGGEAGSFIFTCMSFVDRSNLSCWLRCMTVWLATRDCSLCEFVHIWPQQYVLTSPITNRYSPCQLAV